MSHLAVSVFVVLLVYFGSFSVVFSSCFYCDFVSQVSAILDPHSFVLVSAAPHCVGIGFTCPSLVQFVYMYTLCVTFSLPDCSSCHSPRVPLLVLPC